MKIVEYEIAFFPINTQVSEPEQTAADIKKSVSQFKDANTTLLPKEAPAEFFRIALNTKDGFSLQISNNRVNIKHTNITEKDGFTNEELLKAFSGLLGIDYFKKETFNRAGYIVTSTIPAESPISVIRQKMFKDSMPTSLKETNTLLVFDDNVKGFKANSHVLIMSPKDREEIVFKVDFNTSEEIKPEWSCDGLRDLIDEMVNKAALQTYLMKLKLED